MNGKLGNIIFALVIVVVVVGIGAMIFINSQGNNNAKDAADSDNPSALTKDTERQASIGNKDSKVKVVEFGDYKCPHCAAFDQNVFPELKKDFIDNDKIEYRYVTAPFHGKPTALASKAAQAVYIHAGSQYWTFHHNLYKAAPEDPQKMSEDDWLNESLLDAEIDKLEIADDVAKKIKADYKDNKSEAAKAQKHEEDLTRKYKIQQTPTVFVNGKRMENASDYKALKAEIEKALDKEKKDKKEK